MPTRRLGQTSDASWLAETKNEYQLSEDFLIEDAEDKKILVNVEDAFARVENIPNGFSFKADSKMSFETFKFWTIFVNSCIE